MFPVIMRVVTDGAHDSDALRVLSLLQAVVVNAPRFERTATAVTGYAALPITILGAIRAFSVAGLGPLLYEGNVAGRVGKDLAMDKKAVAFFPEQRRGKSHISLCLSRSH